MQLPDSIRARRGTLRFQTLAPAPPVLAPVEPQQDFIETIRRVWRHRRLVLGCFVVALVVSVVTALCLPTFYTAESQVQVGIPQQPLLSTDLIVRQQDGPGNATVENERLVVLSRGLAQKVIDQLHLADNPAFNPALAPPGFWSSIHLPAFITAARGKIFGGDAKAPTTASTGTAQENGLIDTFLNRISVSAMGRSYVLGIDAEASTPTLAASIANALADAYLKHQRNDKLQDNNRIEGYLTGRINELRDQVEQSEKAAAEYRSANGLYNVPSASLAEQELSQVNTQLIEAQTAKAEADSKLQEALKSPKVGGGINALPEVLSSPLIQALKEQEAEAERNVAQLAAIYGPRHPKMIDAQAQVADIKRKLAMETSRIVDGLRNEARNADARYAALEQNFRKVESASGGANEKMIHLEALERDASVNRNLLDAMLNRYKETAGREEIEQPDAKLVSSAAPPLRPSYPPKTLIVFLGSLGGLLLGCLAALLAESADQTFRRADQVEQATGLPVVAMVPQLRRGVPPVTQVLRAPISPFSDALRKIYIGLQLSETAHSPRTVLFCSATPAEGKTVAVASLARLLARNGKRVLLIDCDWRCPSIHRYFNCSNKDGLAALLMSDGEGMSDAVFNDPLSGLDIIPAGGWNPHTANALISDRMRALLHAVAKNYDLVLIDSAPVLVGSEVLALSRMVDKSVFMLRWGHTNREAALDALRQLADAQADVMGVVMSRVDPKGYREFSYSRLNYDYGRGAFAGVA